MDHPSEETLKRFAAGTASREESRAVVAHLLKGCSACARKLRQLMEPDAVSRTSYEESLDRFDQGLIESLESSIDPLQTLRALKGTLPDLPLERPRKKG
jgi:anti-sigma factor ChrR (cupin superfamily)